MTNVNQVYKLETMAHIKMQLRLDFHLNEKLKELVNAKNKEARLSNRPADFTSKEKEIIKLIETSLK